MFEDWGDFYLLIGSAAGALIGLIFVVVTLTARMARSELLRGATLYMTPIVVNFGMVLSLSAVAMVPHLPAQDAGLLMTGAGAGGLIYFTVILVLFFVRTLTAEVHWTDKWLYGAAPIAIYAVLAAVAAFGVCAEAEWGARAVGAILVVLLLLSIRNAWDLVTWIAPHPDGEPGPEEAAPGPQPKARPKIKPVR